MAKQPKIALIYDRVNTFGGAERVLLSLHEIWPEAPLFTAVYDKKRAPWANVFQVFPSFLQNIPFARNHHELLPTLTPRAFESFNLSSYDIIISITSAEAKFVKKNDKQLHICYCLTPTRYLWSHCHEYEQQGFSGLMLKLFGPMLRMQDFSSSQKVDTYIAISNIVKNRIQKYYRKKAVVIYPPVTINQQLEENIIPMIKPYYLVVSRLVSYKRVDLAIKACNTLHKNLVIIGSGSQIKQLKYLAGETVTFLGNLTDKEIARYYTGCQAVLYPSEEDFGIVPVEAMGFGKPVIGYNKGGVSETILPDKTGILFNNQTTESLIQAIKEFENKTFSEIACKQQAQHFSKDIFKDKIKKAVLDCYNITR